MICPIAGTGTMQDPYRAIVAGVSGVNVQSMIASKPDGSPKYNFVFCRIAATNLAPVLAVSNSYVFPDFPLDSQMSVMEYEVRSGMIQSLEAFDLDGIGLRLVADHDDTDSFRQVIEAIGQQFVSAFDADHFDVVEPQ